MKRDRPYYSRGKKHHDQTMAGLIEIYGNAENRTAAQQRLVDEAGPPRKPRSSPEQRERMEMRKLGVMVQYGRRDEGAPWWAPGFERWESADWRVREVSEQAMQGAQPGWPDCGLFVPAIFLECHGADAPHGDATYHGSGSWTLPCVRVVCEMKEPNKRPKSDVPWEWWLKYRRFRERTVYRDNGRVDVVVETETLSRGWQQSVYGVQAYQLRKLARLSGCGFRTLVAYDADEAFDWFSRIAGPKPDVLPEGW